MRKSWRDLLVTGASAGIGKETAKRLLREGYTVYAAARRLENMRDLGELGAVALEMDVTKEEDLVVGVERINEEQGGIVPRIIPTNRLANTLRSFPRRGLTGVGKV